jgi:hypothetical protein
VPTQDELEANDEDPGQLSAIDAWIDAVLLRHDVDFTRAPTGKITFHSAPEGAVLLAALVAGIYAAARGEELPELPNPPPPKPQKAQKAPKPKKRG